MKNPIAIVLCSRWVVKNPVRTKTRRISSNEFCEIGVVSYPSNPYYFFEKTPLPSEARKISNPNPNYSSTTSHRRFFRTQGPIPTNSKFLGHGGRHFFSTAPDFSKRNRISGPIPLPHCTIPELKGLDLDFVNIAHSHIIHADLAKLNSLSTGLTPFRIKHVLLRIQKDHTLSLEFFNWVSKLRKPNSLTIEIDSIILHILTKVKKFRTAELLLKNVVIPKTADSASQLFDAILYSYRVCDSSPRVFDSLFKTYAHLKKFRNATDTFCRMRDHGFLPTVESCNAYMSSLNVLNRADIVLAFYREMGRCRISPNVYTLNMVMYALCKSGKLEKAMEVFREMESMGCRPTGASLNTLIAGHCNHKLLSSAMKLKNMMNKIGLQPNVVTYNTLIHGFCREGKLHEANKIFSEMKHMSVAPNTVTYNTMIYGYGQLNNSEMGGRLYEEMLRAGVKVDILTYNSLILGLCNNRKTRKASYLVKELDSEKLIPNSSTFSALIIGQCKRQNSERAFQIFKSMKKSGCHPNADTFKMMISTFCKNGDFEGAVQLLREMLERLLVPDVTVMDKLFDGLCSCGKDQMAASLCVALEGKHLLPVGFQKGRISNIQLVN